jgi:CYTH domain-containing protein
MGLGLDIDQETAKALGFPKAHYINVERERRWLCGRLPTELFVATEQISDLYVTGARLRLRTARPLDGGPAMLRLTRKADVDQHTRLISSIYVPEDEFALLATSLKGVTLTKLRHRLKATADVSMCVDVFQGELVGLVLVEAEFKTLEALHAFPAPSFCGREVTADQRFTGGNLVAAGLPADL